VTCWYERAYDGGLARAGLVYAQLVLGGERVPPGQRAKALRALEDAGRGGFPEAQWLLAREHGDAAAARRRSWRAGASRMPDGPVAPRSTPGRSRARPGARAGAGAGQRWLRRAADNGVTPAQFALLEQDWNAGAGRPIWSARCRWRASWPFRGGAGPGPARAWRRTRCTLLSRCARLVDEGAGVARRRARRTARVLGTGRRRAGPPCPVRPRPVVRAHAHRRPPHSGRQARRGQLQEGGALAAAGRRAGLAEAWYALSRIYVKPEFSQRNVVEAQKYLERAAEMGYRDAQLECGNAAWRARRENENNDVRAVFWLQKAAAQGCAKAAAMLRKIAPRSPAPGGTRRCRARPVGHPLLAARLELAVAFGLSRAEALLLDIRQRRPRPLPGGRHPRQLRAQPAPPHARWKRRRSASCSTASCACSRTSIAGRADRKGIIASACTGCGPCCRDGDHGKRIGRSDRRRLRRTQLLSWPREHQSVISPSNTVSAGPLR
jgi:TPR repeat protein